MNLVQKHAGQVDDRVQWVELLVRERSCQLVLKIALNLLLFELQDLCDVGQDQQLALRAILEMQRFDLDFDDFGLGIFV